MWFTVPLVPVLLTVTDGLGRVLRANPRAVGILLESIGIMILQRDFLHSVMWENISILALKEASILYVGVYVTASFPF
jgi:hypothetical protein